MSRADILLSILYKISPKIIRIRMYKNFGWRLNYLYGYKDKDSTVFEPIYFGNLRNIYLYKYTRLQCGAKIITNKCRFIVKQYSAFGAGLTVATTNHIPTVGVPHYFLGKYHINDNEKDIIVEEDVWGGTNVTLLNGAHVGRGCVIGAGTIINKEIPPYAVVVGIPGKIIKYKYSIEQIIEHEKKLYPENERMSREQLEDLFSKYYNDKKQMSVINQIDDKDIKELISNLY